jgi:phosphoadenosine phosphosulfate reductase
VVVAHLAATADVPVRLVWVRGNPWDTPECEQVRDAFLARHPHVAYEERPVVYGHPRRGERGWTPAPPPGRRPSWTFAEVVTERWVSGVRAAESRARAVSAAVHGAATDRTCRPILRWSASDVFAFLHGADLPVHPVYAMSDGGRYDRAWLRVHALGGSPVSTRDDPGHARRLHTWEDVYYGDVIAAAVASRA